MTPHSLNLKLAVNFSDILVLSFQQTLPTLIPPSWIRGQEAIFEIGHKPF